MLIKLQTQMLRAITGIYSCMIYRHRVTRGFYTNTSFINIHKYCFWSFVRIYFKMTNVLFCIKANVLGLDGIVVTDELLLFSHSTYINIHSLPFASVLLAPYSMLCRVEYSSKLIHSQCNDWVYSVYQSAAYCQHKSCGFIISGVISKID